MKNRVVELAAEINAKGWVAFHHSRLKTVSINGGRQLSYKDAITLMESMLAIPF